MFSLVLIRKGFRFRVYPTPAQIARLLAWETALRFLWNLANEQRWMALRRTPVRRVAAFDQINELTALRAELPWLDDVPRDVCAQLLVELDLTWQRWRKRLAEEPNWKAKGRDELGLCEPHPKKWRLDGAKAIRFPKAGRLRAVLHRPLEGKPKSCTLKRDGDQWFASIVCEIEIADPAPRTAPVIALDRGVANIVADSDGHREPNPKHLERAQRRLAHAQRDLARKRKGSKNREKAKVRVMRIHRKVRRQREWTLHKLSHDYAKSHGIVVIEKLNISNMTKSASGTIDKPGKKVAQKRGLNRAILSMGWGILKGQLRYKLAWSGGQLVEVPAQYSSQTCSRIECGHVDAASRKSQAEFCCTKCGLVEHADVNAAKVLLQRFQTPGSPWCLPVDGSACKGPERSRKRLRVVRCSPEKLRPSGRG